MIRLLILIILISCNTLFSQNITGFVIDAESKQPIEYTNIGIISKNVGTVSDLNGRFKFLVDSKYDNDTILFSIIGYKSFFSKNL